MISFSLTTVQLNVHVPGLCKGYFNQTEAQNETKEAQVLRLRLKKWAVINIGHRGKDSIDYMQSRAAKKQFVCFIWGFKCKGCGKIIKESLEKIENSKLALLFLLSIVIAAVTGCAGQLNVEMQIHDSF